MRITQISVQRLFGLFDHVIPLNLEDRITIIHGPNGIGKTILLTMIDALFHSRYKVLESIQFEEFLVSFDDESKIRIIRKPQLELFFSKPGVVEDRVLPTTETVRTDVRLLLLTNQQEPPKPLWLSERQDALSVHFVETQRLLFFRPPKSGLASLSSPKEERQLKVEKCSQELSEQIESTLAESAEVSQSIDRTFPARLITNPSITLSERQIRTELSQLENEQTRLASLGLLVNGNSLELQSTLPIDEKNRNVLSIYIEDAKKKLAVFDKLAAKLELLQKIVNQKFLYKKLAISKEKGFVLNTSSGRPLPLNSLSSGEQHELVLLYELLFNAKSGALILIDEPEISLHLSWQESFLRDLQQICRLAELDIILATHSADIISDRWDLTVELKGPVQ